MVQNQLPSQIPAAPQLGPAEEEGMTLIEHLIELRGRLVKAGIGVIIGLCFGAFLVLGPPQLMNLMIYSLLGDLAQPGAVVKLFQAISATEMFTSSMTLSLGIGVVCAMPVIVYQLIAFIAPALLPHEKRYVLTALPFVTGFFLSGVVFGWFITVPAAMRFLLLFGNSDFVQVQPSIADFISTVTTLLLINGVVFEMPVIIYIFAALGVVSAERLASWRRYAFVANVIIAAIITPTGDPVNLLLLAIPMHLLFELGIIFARFAPKRLPRSKPAA
jgi:sec-independent protein translocase protein TatC